MKLQVKLKLEKVIVIVIAWVMVSLCIAIYDHFAFQSTFSLGPSDSYTIGTNILFNVLSAILGASMGGAFLVFYVNEKLRQKSYGYSIIAVAIAFVVIVALITIVLGMVFIWVTEGVNPITDSKTRDIYYEYLTNPLHAKNIIVWSLVVALTQMFLQINDKFGPGLLWDFIRGKYHQPIEEERIFMFLDLKNSTPIAEKLGNVTYYSFLKDFYADITNPVIYNRGEIYQYVGDEVVISWNLKNGIKSNRCVQCFFDIKHSIEKKRDKYLKRYGCVPEFKAGLHCGKVTAGEIGIIKRDITYSGDVLNTTSRIQASCNSLDVSILLSADLMGYLSFNGEFLVRKIGAVNLKGKVTEVDVSTISEVNN